MEFQMKNTTLTTDLFKGKNISSIISAHPIFKTPMKIEKIWSSIGLPNCKEKANIDKCLVDIKKDGSHVHNMLAALCNHTTNAKALVYNSAEAIRFLAASKEERLKATNLITDAYELANSLGSFGLLCDPHQPDVLANAIVSVSGKVELRLYQDILDLQGKPLYKKGGSLLKIYNRLQEKALAHNVNMLALDQMLEFKIFSKENVPNKGYDICFSSEGEEGAWDIATMSMRGIKSCQRWDGEYPRCLIGSIVSKFVGLIYLTSGSNAPAHGEWGSLGTKMLKRCVVRYAYDRDVGEKGSPCILLDRMYPDPIDAPDRDILKIFIDFLHAKTKLPVYFGPELKNKIKHIYLPNDKIMDGISKREFSYQDTPLRSKDEFDAQILFQNRSEIERYSKLFQNNMAVFMAAKMEQTYKPRSNQDLDKLMEIKSILDNVNRNIPFTQFSLMIVQYALASFAVPNTEKANSSREYYRLYLREFFKQRKKILELARPHIISWVNSNTSRALNTNRFADFLSDLIVQYVKNEILHPTY
jgi:hypothetical protein